MRELLLRGRSGSSSWAIFNQSSAHSRSRAAGRSHRGVGPAPGAMSSGARGCACALQIGMTGISTTTFKKNSVAAIPFFYGEAMREFVFEVSIMAVVRVRARPRSSAERRGERARRGSRWASVARAPARKAGEGKILRFREQPVTGNVWAIETGRGVTSRD